MIIFKRCYEVSGSVVFETFLKGFIDYPVKFTLEEEQFLERFFGPEGNSLDHSFIAMNDEKGIGLIFGGIRSWDGIKTLRCGTMCIVPEFRGKGVAQDLWGLHKEEGIRQGCKQLFLEVLQKNSRAIHFYEKNGYEKRYELKYYNDVLQEGQKVMKENIVPISFDELKAFRQNEFLGLHINWQNEMESIQFLNTENYGIWENGHLVAAVSIKNGNLFFIGVQEKYRNRGYGTKLLNYLRGTGTTGIRISFPDNASLEGFCKKNGMKLSDVRQYEMYQNICK